MTTIFTEVDAWLTAAVLTAAMLLGWGVGYGWGRRWRHAPGVAPGSKFTDASVAMVGLLLAFTFSMSLGKHEQRRQMVIVESSAIGDFYTCVTLLPEPQRSKLQKEIRGYLAHRLAISKTPLDDSTLEGKLAEIQQMHQRMTAFVGEAVDAKTNIVFPLVNTLNAVTSSHAARLAAVRDRLPASIIIMLFVATFVSMKLLGIQQGVAGERHLEATLGFAALVGIVVWVTLDLNQPRRGLILVSQEPLQRLLSGME